MTYVIRPEWQPQRPGPWLEAPSDQVAALFTVMRESDGVIVDVQHTRSAAAASVARLTAAERRAELVDVQPATRRPRPRPLLGFLALVAWAPVLWIITGAAGTLGPWALVPAAAWLAVALVIWRHFLPPG